MRDDAAKWNSIVMSAWHQLSPDERRGYEDNARAPAQVFEVRYSHISTLENGSLSAPAMAQRVYMHLPKPRSPSTSPGAHDELSHQVRRVRAAGGQHRGAD